MSDEPDIRIGAYFQLTEAPNCAGCAKKLQLIAELEDLIRKKDNTIEALEALCNKAAHKLAAAIQAETVGFLPLMTMVEAIPGALELARENGRRKKLPQHLPCHPTPKAPTQGNAEASEETGEEAGE